MALIEGRGGRGRCLLGLALLVLTALVGSALASAYNKPHSEVTPQCPDGYHYDGEECVKQREVPETYVCPPGSLHHHGECEKQLPAKFHCPPRFVLEDKTCVAKEIVPIVSQCPEGSTQRGAECVVLLEHPPRCPEGTARVGDRCASFTPVVKECPSGYKVWGDLCATQLYEVPRSVCPTGTYPEGKECKAVIKANRVCPHNTFNVGGHCASYADKLHECPTTYTFSGQSCLKTEQAPKVATCLNGADPNNNCAIREDVPFTEYCYNGRVCAGDDRCVGVERRERVYSCPDGYVLHHKKCIREGQHSRGSYNYNTGIDAVFNCPPGTSLSQGKYCVEEVIASVVLRCDAKVDSASKCFREETASPISRCPIGSIKTDQGCTVTDIKPPHYYCPPGTVEPDCAILTEKVCPKAGCISSVISVPPLPVCPDGFHLIKGGHNRPTCARTVYVDQISACPRGTVQADNLKCASFDDFVVQKSYRRVPTQQLCPLGFAKSAYGCVKRVLVEAEAVCPHGATPLGYECIRSFRKIKACPHGAARKHGGCYAVSTVTPLLIRETCGYGGCSQACLKK